MKTSVKYSLIGGAIGFVLACGCLLAIVFWDGIPTTKEQVFDYLEENGYKVDTLMENYYTFEHHGSTCIFRSIPDDNDYLCIFLGRILPDFTQEELLTVANEVMQIKKNCTIIVENEIEPPSVRIEINSFVKGNIINTYLIERSIHALESADLYFCEMLLEMYGDRESGMVSE